MNRYDKDMMHNRELIYDAKGQLHKADKKYKKGELKAKYTELMSKNTKHTDTKLQLIKY
jgi:hypothetical protein